MWRTNPLLSAPFQRGSVSLKCCPMSPRPAAPKERIAQGMQNHITIRVRHDAAGMRNAHPAQHNELAGPEGVDIDTLAYSHNETLLGDNSAAACAQQRSREQEIIGTRDLDIGGRALNQHRPLDPSIPTLAPHRSSGRPVAERTVQCVTEHLVPKHLGGERAPESRAIHRLFDLVVTGRVGRASWLASTYRRLGARRQQTSNRVGADTRQQLLQILEGETRTCGVMHQHPVIAIGSRCERRKPVAHGLTPLRTTLRDK